MSKAQREAIREALRARPKGFDEQPIEEMRASFAEAMGRFAVTDEVTCTDIEYAGRPAVDVQPRGTARPGRILYFHGGSYVFGSPRTTLGITAQLVRRTGMRAVSPAYRLAPEHPFPAAIEDCTAAYRALLDEGADPGTIALIGDSAGGGLAVATALSARDQGLPMPGAIVTFSAALDHTLSGASMEAKKASDLVVSRDGLLRTSALYLGGEPAESPLASPAVHGDLAGFPPMLLQVGGDEVLLDDSVRLARRAAGADVDVVLDVTAGVSHVFQAYVDTLDEAGQALDRAALFLTQRLRRRFV